MLHPGLKLEYFRGQDWEQEWIDVAESLTREEYMDSYEKLRLDPFFSPDHSAAANVVLYRMAMMPIEKMTSGTSPWAKQLLNGVRLMSTWLSQLSL